MSQTNKIKKTMSNKIAYKLLAACILAFVFSFAPWADATVYGVLPEINITIGADLDNLDENFDSEALGASVTLQILFLTILIALLPSLLVIMTSFTRLIIVFSFLRSALGTQQMPPNQVLIGLALVLTLFIMSPYIDDINQNAFGPFANGQISQDEAVERTMEPLRRFMLRQPRVGDNILFFLQLTGMETPETPEDTPNTILIPAFILHELTTGFFIGVMIFIPFIVIDMVVASVLMAMGMMMLPPAMISLPFKVLLFVIVDGWQLIVQTLYRTFH